MKWRYVLRIINIIFPAIGIGLMIYYDACDTSCAYLKGTFAGIDLKYIGILFMALLLALALLPALPRITSPVNHLRTIMLAGSLGAEVLLVRFQIVKDTHCPFCLAFGACLLIMLVANLTQMNKYLAIAAFLAGIGAFALFFNGSVLPPSYVMVG